MMARDFVSAMVFLDDFANWCGGVYLYHEQSKEEKNTKNCCLYHVEVRTPQSRVQVLAVGIVWWARKVRLVSQVW